jgi:N-carbamoylputrescine amidase
MTNVSVAATQMACSWDIEANIGRAEEMVREAAGKGANIVLLQELFETPYFCPDQKREHFGLAKPFEGNPLIGRFARLAAELGVVLPVSFFERTNNAYYNAIAIVDADGTVLGRYRKSHIPQGPGYEEKYYFSPGDTGFRVWETRFGAIGVGICWDQWFPECARSMALMGADILLYPTAIGSEPNDTSTDSSGHWQRTMQGHAAANMVALAASNRIGVEENDSATMTFYGLSFIAGPTGKKLAEARRDDQAIVMADFDFDEIRTMRASWGLFRDRRPDLYEPLLTLDGETF